MEPSSSKERYGERLFLVNFRVNQWTPNLTGPENSIHSCHGFGGSGPVEA
jgi:hypothetical protein